LDERERRLGPWLASPGTEQRKMARRLGGDLSVGEYIEGDGERGGGLLATIGKANKWGRGLIKKLLKEVNMKPMLATGVGAKKKGHWGFAEGGGRHLKNGTGLKGGGVGSVKKNFWFLGPSPPKLKCA